LNDKGWPSDDEFKKRFVRFNLYRSMYDRVVMSALEDAVQAKSEPVVLAGCSIEHFMPRSVDDADEDGKTWTDALGAGWREVHTEWLDTPGNLTLVGADYNSSMSREPAT
jgi:hypothetical protein